MLEYSRLKLWVWLSTWTILIFTALYFRPLMPVDETRYVSVAWEMWLNKNFLVPHLNGSPYSHKPPLLFWLINFGWEVFGINEWWPRLVAPIFGLGCLILSVIICRKLWPLSQAHFIVPIMLLGTFYWGIYTTLTMFDLIITFWALVGLIGLIDIWKGQKLRGWIFFTLAIGLGLLTKGPVIFVYILPSALFAPYWAKSEKSINWIYWYAKIIVGICCGVLIALIWAIPAGIAGGAEYQNLIFWGQSAGRIVESFAHREPIWWYIAIIPILLLPWLLWPTLIYKLWTCLRGKKKKWDPSLRLLLLWATSTVVILSLISGKQPHYLMPIFPALAILGAILISNLTINEFFPTHWDLLPYISLLFLLGLTGLFAPELGNFFQLSDWSAEINRWWALIPIGFGIMMIGKPPERGYKRVFSISLLSPILIISSLGLFEPAISKGYDLRPVANYIARAQRQGYVVGNYGKYHGQFHFLGKLEKPIFETGDGNIKEWLSKTPRAKVISVHKKINKQPPVPDFVQKYRGKYILVWDRTTVMSHPSAPQRKQQK